MDVKEIVAEISKPHSCLECGRDIAGFISLCDRCFTNAFLCKPEQWSEIRRKLAEAKKGE